MQLMRDQIPLTLAQKLIIKGIYEFLWRQYGKRS
jgi:hypothetical protein